MNKEKIQLARELFLSSVSTMKSILSLLEFKMGKKSDEYLYIRKEVMEYTYKNLKKLFKEIEENKIIKKCPNKCKLRQGYKKCICGGSGYLNA